MNIYDTNTTTLTRHIDLAKIADVIHNIYAQALGHKEQLSGIAKGRYVSEEKGMIHKALRETGNIIYKEACQISDVVIAMCSEIKLLRSQKKVSNSSALDHVPHTMSSRQIAEVTGKQHKHVIRDIKTMYSQLDEDGPKMDHDARGYVVAIHLDQDHLLTLITGYNVQMRHAIIKRWRELEQGVRSGYASTRSCVEGSTPQLEYRSEAVAYQKLTKAEGALSVTDTAKQLAMKPSHLFRYLQANNWIYRRAGNAAWHGKAYRCNVGDVTHTVYTITKDDGEERIREQVKITPQGLTKLAKVVG